MLKYNKDMHLFNINAEPFFVFNLHFFYKGFSIYFKFLIFMFNFITNVYCGKYTKVNIRKWFLQVDIFNGWHFGIGLGISEDGFLEYRLRRGIKMMSPEKLKKLFDLFENYL